MTLSHPPFSTFFARLRRLPAWVAARPAAAILLFLAIGWLCYFPSLAGDFVWDDAVLVQNNPAIRSPVFFPDVFQHHLSFDSPSNFYRPVQNLSFMGDYLLWELEPYGYRLTNLLLHLFNAGLLFLLLRRVLPKLLPASESPDGIEHSGLTGTLALLVAVFWLVHPIHSAAVAYISGRADSLAMGFALLAWLAWERGNAAAERAATLPAAGLFVGSCVSLLLALCSKEIAMIWLALFGLYFLLGRPVPPVRRRVLTFLCALLVFGCYLGLRQLADAPKDAFVPPAPPMPPKLVLMSRSLGDYASVLLWPVRLFMERQVFPAYGKAATAADQWHYHTLFVGGLLALAVLVAGAVWRAPGQRLRRFGVAWFLVAWLPISNLWALNASVAEHWLYVPSVGFLLFVVGVALALPALPLRLRLLRVWAVAPAALAAVLALLVVRTNFRSADWFDEETFYRQTLAAGTRSPRARLMLARALSRSNHLAEAETALRALLADYPGYGMGQLNLAQVLIRAGRVPEAAELLHALRDSTSPARRTLLPSVWRTLMRLPGENPDAEVTLARLDPDLVRLPLAWDLVEIKARLLCQLGRVADAEAVVSAYRATRPWHYPATMLLGELLEERDDFAHAEALYRAAGRLDVHEVASRRARALLLLREHQPEAARRLAQEAIDRQPAQALSYLVLARACVELGLPQDAAAAAAQATRLGMQPLAASP